MSKGQKRSNREVKKPKTAKAKEPAAASFTESLTKAKSATHTAGKK